MKSATSCYRDQVSSISSYRCKKNGDFVEKQPSTKDAEKNLWLNVIACKEKDIKKEIHNNIILCKQSLAVCNEKLSLTLGQEIPILKATRRLIDGNLQKTKHLSWTRFKSRLDVKRTDARKRVAAIALQSKCRSRMARKQLAMRMNTIVKIQCLVRKHIARRQVRGLKIKKRRREPLLVREQLVRAYVARCQRRKRKERHIHMQLVREKAIRLHAVLCQRKKLVELEHTAATTCQSAIRGFFARRQLQGRGEIVCSLVSE